MRTRLDKKIYDAGCPVAPPPPPESYESEGVRVRQCGGEDRQLGSGPAGDRERERERPDCNILSVNPSQSPLLPESLSSSVISLCWHLEFQYSERHPSLTSGQDRAELDGRFHNFSLSLCPSGVIWSSRRSSVGNIKIRFTEIRVWKSTTFDKNYTLILTVHFMRRFKVILESNTIIW